MGGLFFPDIIIRTFAKRLRDVRFLPRGRGGKGLYVMHMNVMLINVYRSRNPSCHFTASRTPPREEIKSIIKPFKHTDMAGFAFPLNISNISLWKAYQTAVAIL